ARSGATSAAGAVALAVALRGGAARACAVARAVARAAAATFAAHVDVGRRLGFTLGDEARGEADVGLADRPRRLRDEPLLGLDAHLQILVERTLRTRARGLRIG